MRKKKATEPRESSLASGWTVEGDLPIAQTGPARDLAVAPTPGTEGAGELSEHEASAVSQISNAALVLFGVFGGLYLLYTWVWISWAQYYSDVNAVTAAGSGIVGGVLQQIVFWAVPFAPALWFLCAVLIHRQSTRRLAISLLVGAIVLIPLPLFELSGAAL